MEVADVEATPEAAADQTAVDVDETVVTEAMADVTEVAQVIAVSQVATEMEIANQVTLEAADEVNNNQKIVTN